MGIQKPWVQRDCEISILGDVQAEQTCPEQSGLIRLGFEQQVGLDDYWSSSSRLNYSLILWSIDAGGTMEEREREKQKVRDQGKKIVILFKTQSGGEKKTQINREEVNADAVVTS